MTPLIGPVAPPDLHVMTFNVRRRLAWAPRPADRWRHRAPLVTALLSREQPDLLAAQEVLPDQADVLLAALDGSPSPSPGRYRRVGHGRSVTRGRHPVPRGEATPLFYRADRLQLQSWTQRALSERPDAAGSISGATWVNLIPRVFVEAVFLDRATGAEFIVIGTHFDVFSARARLHSATVIGARIAAQSRPAIMLGDLNAGPDSPPMRELRDRGGLDDGWRVADERLTPEWGTFGGYRRPREGRARIDHILTTRDVEVRRIGIHAAPIDGRWPSDHLPVQAVVRITTGAPA